MFASGTELEQHVQRHLDKPYECSICGGRFLQVSQLNKHLDNRTLGCLGKDTASKTSKPCDILEHNYELKNDVHGKQTLEHEFQDITDWYEVVEENSTVENICEDFKIDDVNEVNCEFSFVNKDNVKCVIKDEEQIRHEEVYFESSAAYDDAAHNKGIKNTNDYKTLQPKCNKQNVRQIQSYFLSDRRQRQRVVLRNQGASGRWPPLPVISGGVPPPGSIHFGGSAASLLLLTVRTYLSRHLPTRYRIQGIQ